MSRERDASQQVLPHELHLVLSLFLGGRECCDIVSQQGWSISSKFTHVQEASTFYGRQRRLTLQYRTATGISLPLAYWNSTQSKVIVGRACRNLLKDGSVGLVHLIKRSGVPYMLPEELDSLFKSDAYAKKLEGRLTSRQAQGVKRYEA